MFNWCSVLERKERERELARRRVIEDRDRLERERHVREGMKSKEQELQKQKEQRMLEVAEQKQMKLNDYDVNGTKARIRSSENESDAITTAKQGEDEMIVSQFEMNRRFEGDNYVADLYNNLLALQNRLRSFTGGNQSHERREEYRSFFMPLNFSSDIRFDLFDSSPSTLWRDGERDTPSPSNPVTCGFQDIDARVDFKKSQIEEERVRQRWKMHSKEDIENWTTIGTVFPSIFHIVFFILLIYSHTPRFKLAAILCLARGQG